MKQRVNLNENLLKNIETFRQKVKMIDGINIIDEDIIGNKK